MQDGRRKREAWQQEVGRQEAAAAAAAEEEVKPSWAELSMAESRSIQRRPEDTFGSELANPDCGGSGVTLWWVSSGVGLLSEPASRLGLGCLWGAEEASSGLRAPTVFTVTSTAGGTVSARDSGCCGTLGVAAASAFCEVVQKCLITRTDNLRWSAKKCFYLQKPFYIVLHLACNYSLH